MFPPLPPLRVAIDTITQATSRSATTIPADPPASPFASSVLLIPAAHDWKLTKTNKMIDSIPDTSFHVFISFPSFLYDFLECIYSIRYLRHINTFVSRGQCIYG